ncbi:MAG: methylisocitrate lyase, partial [Pseudomonadota bacterium]|nr:methylisocitrate lyase [Pseudomonadota bacterium]
MSAGRRFRDALLNEQPLQIVGVINAYAAKLAESAGFQAIYLSGAGVANAGFALPDVGVTNLTDVVREVSCITNATALPLLVDADTGWGNDIGIARTVRELIQAGAAGLHIEDQVDNKRCGHLHGKALVSVEEMQARIMAAVAAKIDPEFVIMARTDAVAVEGLKSAIERAQHYVQAGAEMIFAEALTDLTQYREFIAAVKVPVLANITEFGKTPLFTLDELREAGVAMALYPLSAFRAMNAAALNVF